MMVAMVTISVPVEVAVAQGPLVAMLPQITMAEMVVLVKLIQLVVLVLATQVAAAAVQLSGQLEELRPMVAELVVQ
jgi:hypothetical protein